MAEEPEFTATLNELVSTAAVDWSGRDRKALIEAYREQRSRWNAEQNAGSKKRVTSKQIPTTAKPSKKGLKFMDIKL